jgi:hypothetical protein
MRIVTGLTAGTEVALVIDCRADLLGCGSPGRSHSAVTSVTLDRRGPR